MSFFVLIFLLVAQSIAGDFDIIEDCFPRTHIRIYCDGLSEHGFEESAELTIEARHEKGAFFEYGYGRSFDASLCHTHLRAIEEIIQNASKVCIGGWGGVDYNNDEHFRHWSYIKTSAGRVDR